MPGYSWRAFRLQSLQAGSCDFCGSIPAPLPLRFKTHFIADFRQLIKKGAIFTNARYKHYSTYTAVLHAALLTGAYPSINSIVGKGDLRLFHGLKVLINSHVVKSRFL
jgi:hypothetical protein